MQKYVPNELLWDFLDRDVPAYKSLMVPDLVQNVTLKRYQLLFQIQKSFSVFNRSIYANTFPINYGVDSVPLIGCSLISEIMVAEVQDGINEMIQGKIS